MILAEYTCVLHGDKLLSEESFYLKLFSSIANKLDRFMSHVSVKLSMESIRQNTKYSIFKARALSSQVHLLGNGKSLIENQNLCNIAGLAEIGIVSKFKTQISGS